MSYIVINYMTNKCELQTFLNIYPCVFRAMTRKWTLRASEFFWLFIANLTQGEFWLFRANFHSFDILHDYITLKY